MKTTIQGICSEYLRLLRGWIIVIFAVLTIIMVFFEAELMGSGSEEYLPFIPAQFNAIYGVGRLIIKPKYDKFKYLLPSNAIERKIKMINTTKILFFLVAIWFLMIHIINIAIGNYSLFEAMQKFIGVHLLISLFISIGYFYNSTKKNVKIPEGETKKDNDKNILVILLLLYSLIYSLLLYHFLIGYWNILAAFLAYISYIPVLYYSQSMSRQINICYENIKRT